MPSALRSLRGKPSRVDGVMGTTGEGYLRVLRSPSNSSAPERAPFRFDQSRANPQARRFRHAALQLRRRRPVLIFEGFRLQQHWPTCRFAAVANAVTPCSHRACGPAYDRRDQAIERRQRLRHDVAPITQNCHAIAHGVENSSKRWWLTSMDVPSDFGRRMTSKNRDLGFRKRARGSSDEHRAKGYGARCHTLAMGDIERTNHRARIDMQPRRLRISAAPVHASSVDDAEAMRLPAKKKYSRQRFRNPRAGSPGGRLRCLPPALRSGSLNATGP